MRDFKGYPDELQMITNADDLKEVEYCIDEQIEMFIDDNNRIWTEGGIYIADLDEEEVEAAAWVKAYEENRLEEYFENN